MYVPCDDKQTDDKITIIQNIDFLVPGKTCIEINDQGAVFYGHKLSEENKTALKWLKNICASEDDYARSLDYTEMPVNTLFSRPGYVVVPIA